MASANALAKPAVVALRQASRNLDAARRRPGNPILIGHALAQMASALRRLPDDAHAESYLDEALRWARAGGSTDLIVDLLCELCEVCAALSATAGHDAGHAAGERLREHAFEASTLANRVADGAWEARVLLRVGAVLERCGERDDAVLLQTRAHRLLSGGLAGGAPDPALLPSLGRLADS